MKKILCLILAVSGFAACKKSGTPSHTGGLIGKWELHRRYGGFIIPPDTTYKPGNGNILQFNADSTYKRYTNGTLTQSGIFHTRNYFSDRMTAARFDELYFDSDTAAKSLVNVSGTLLAVGSLIPDVGTTVYEKLQN
jgi:hypothetical protein